MMPAEPISIARCAALFAATPPVKACATKPVTGSSDFLLISEEQEIAPGRQANTRILKETPANADPELEPLEQQVGKELANHSHRPARFFRFTMSGSMSINAFALPGGYIPVTRDLLEYLNSEAELAAVPGHEIGHVTARHSVRQQSTAAVTGIPGTTVTAANGRASSVTAASVTGHWTLPSHSRKTGISRISKKKFRQYHRTMTA
jgi:predicted Zn-dependent protease